MKTPLKTPHLSLKLDKQGDNRATGVRFTHSQIGGHETSGQQVRIFYIKSLGDLSVKGDRDDSKTIHLLKSQHRESWSKKCKTIISGGSSVGS